MLRGESALTHARRIRAQSHDVRTASRSARRHSEALRARATRQKARAARLCARAPYASLVGTRMGRPVRILIRRDGTVCSEPEVGGDPLTATVAAARDFDHVAGVVFHRAGWRTGVPLVRAAAHLDEDQQADRVRAVREAIADGLSDGVVRRIFEAGLAATSALTRTSDADVQRQLSFVVETLDEALAQLRLAIFDVAASADPIDDDPA